MRNTNVPPTESVITSTADEIRAFYDDIANEYDKSRRTGSGRLFNEHIEMPATWSLLEPLRAGNRVLDIGCGPGLYARRLAEVGCKVTAVDLSQTMLEVARRNCAGMDVKFVLGDARELTGLGTFDCVLGSYMVGYFDHLAEWFGRLRTFLDGDSKLVLSMTHPIRLNAELRNPTPHLSDYFGRGRYLSEIVPGRCVAQPRRTVEDIMQAAFSSGFALDGLREPRPQGDLHEFDPLQVDLVNHLPAVLCLRFTPRG
jgi:ubiquinone/menaquinone biosynthesis C-methylase UbiE